MKKKNTRPASFGVFLLEHFADPDNSLPCDQGWWEKDGNPYHVWHAIYTCGQYQREFPEWVRDYLVACAHRMLLPKAVKQKDFRDALRWVMGFPAKRGPGHPLQPFGDDKSDDYALLAQAFAVQIGNGEKPVNALTNALGKMPAGLRLQNADHKTLMTNIARYFRLKRVPRTAGEWDRAILAWYRETFGSLLVPFSVAKSLAK